MQIYKILLLLLSLNLTGCLASSSEVVTTHPNTTTAMAQQFILKPAVAKVTGVNGELTASYLELLSQSANAKLVYLRPMFGGAHVLRFEQPLVESTAMSVFSTWKQRGLVEYAEVDGIAHIAPR